MNMDPGKQATYRIQNTICPLQTSDEETLVIKDECFKHAKFETSQ